MFVCCECCVLSGRGLCDDLITRQEESYRLWCVVVCDLETSRMRGHDPRWVAAPQKKKKIYVCVYDGKRPVGCRNGDAQGFLPLLLCSPPAVSGLLQSARYVYR